MTFKLIIPYIHNLELIETICLIHIVGIFNNVIQGMLPLSCIETMCTLVLLYYYKVAFEISQDY